MALPLPLPQLQLPVFAYPDELIFYALNRDHHKQMITIYNPYGFLIRYKLSCINPELFDVQDCEGSVRDHHTIVIHIRLSQLPAHSVVPIESKFRIQIFDGRQRSRQHGGQKIILSKISFDPVPEPKPGGGPSMSSAGSELSGSFFRTEGSISTAAVTAAAAGGGTNERDIDSYRGGHGGGGGHLPPPHVNYVAVATAIVCIFALLLPNEKEPSPNIPIYLHLSINMKLMIAYALGLVTMVIFRP